jgi:Na+/melibiose symporter-like transporter
MLFIFLIVVAPGTTDAMFYLESNVLNYSPTVFGTLNVIGSCSSIVGVWLYRACCAKVKLKKLFLATTVSLALF